MKKIILRWISMAGFLLILTAGHVWAADSDLSVWLDGEAVPFTTAGPTVQDGKTYLPLRALLEAAGAQVSYENSTNILTVKKDQRTVSFALSNPLQVTEDGQTEVTDFFCRTEQGCLLVPTRFAAQFFGFNAGWDQKHKTIVLTDVGRLMQTVQGQFTTMDAYLTYLNQLSQKTYGVDGTINTLMQVKGENGESIPWKTDSTVSGMVSDKGAEITLDSDSDLSAALSGMDQQTITENSELLALMKKNTAVCLFPGDGENVYVQSSLYSFLGGIGKDAWYQTSPDSVYERYGLDPELIHSLPVKGSSFAQEMETFLQNLEVTDRKDTLVNQMFQLYKSAFTDKNFSLKDSGYTAIGSITTDDHQIYTIQPIFKMRVDSICGSQFILTKRTENMTETLNVTMTPENELNLDFSRTTNHLTSTSKASLRFVSQDGSITKIPPEGTIYPIQRLVSLFGM